MRVLTIRQPWLWAILDIEDGPKDVDNRSRPTKYRGELLLHSSKGFHDSDMREADAFMRSIGVTPPTWEQARHMRTGWILGIAELYDCRLRPSIERVGQGAPAFSKWHAPGKWGHMLRDVRKLANPIPWKGMLGYVHATPEVIAAVRAQS